MCDESLKEYISEYRSSNILDKKINVCEKYKNIFWLVIIGMEAWEEVGSFALIQHEIDGIGKVKLAVPIDIACANSSYKVKAPSETELIQKLGCELLAVSKV